MWALPPTSLVRSEHGILGNDLDSLIQPTKMNKLGKVAAAVKIGAVMLNTEKQTPILLDYIKTRRCWHSPMQNPQGTCR